MKERDFDIGSGFENCGSWVLKVQQIEVHST